MFWKVIGTILILCVAIQAADVSNQTDCGPEKIWLECGSACPGDCQRPWRVCVMEPCVPGCFCRFPTLWSERLQKCVFLFLCGIPGLAW